MSKEEKDQRYHEMISLVRQWENSGKSQVQFIREYNLKQYQFYYWLKRYRQSSAAEGFIPVKVLKGKARVKIPDAAIVIRYPNGTSIHLPYSTPLSTIRTLAGL